MSIDSVGPGTVGKRAIRGAAWTLPTSLGARIVGLVGTLALARYVAPADYGEVSAAAIVALTANNVSTFGVGIYVVSRRQLTAEEAWHATFWFLLTGLVALGLAASLAGPLATLFEAQGLVRYLPLLLGSTLLDRIAYLPERVMVRELRFKRLSLARAAGELVFTAVSLMLAARGVGAMSIAWANLARSALRFGAIVPAVPWRAWLEPHRLRLAVIWRIVTYGANVALTSIAEFGLRRWDNLMVSRFFGPAVMGAYNYAYNLAEVPAAAVGEQLGDVIFASLPHVEEERRAGALVRAATLVSIIMLPLAFGLGAVAPTVVQTFFDAKWASIGGMLTILTAVSATRPVCGVFSSYLYARDRPGSVLWLQVASLAAMVVTLLTVGRLGIHWTCAAVAAVFVAQTLATMWAVKHLDGVPVSRFLAPLLGPLVACSIMAAAVVAARPLLGGLRPGARLAAEVFLGVTIYLVGAATIFRASAGELVRLARSALLKRA